MNAAFVNLPRLFFGRFSALLPILLAARLGAQTPEWIWHDNQGRPPQENEVRFFRKSFQVDGPVTRARLTAAGDDQAIVFLNGRQVGVSRSPNKPITINVAREIRTGANVLAVRGQNATGSAAFLVQLEIALANDRTQAVVSDTSWTSSAVSQSNWYAPQFDPQGWTAVISRGRLGVPPWGDILSPSVATPAERLTVPPDFKVELVRLAEPGEGSWISLTIDPKGRLIVSPEEGVGNLLRATLSASGQIEKVERVDSPVGSAVGLLYAFDSLYLHGNGPKGLGLYRLRDTNGDDHFDDLRLLRKWEGAAGERGAHAIVAGPNHQLYTLHGPSVRVPTDISPNSPHQHYAEDQLLPRTDESGRFGAGLKSVGGFLLRTDPDGTNWELVAAGLRDACDFDVEADGEIFTFDSDTEGDRGTPWYRPTRICHLVSGGDYGFREGAGQFPADYPDILPPALEVGIGSPAGVKFGAKSQFPPKYQKALFALDRAYGRIFAVHLKPAGGGYTATCEEFLRGQPLPLTDLEFGPDGAMYFLSGGRGAPSGLYRVSCLDGPNKPVGTDESPWKQSADARQLRRQLEAFHGRKEPAAIEFAWPHLDNSDRWIRYAARLAIESQDLTLWQERALREARINASLTALLALARRGSTDLQPDLLQALGRLPSDQLSESQRLEALRVVALAFIRLGRPDLQTAEAVSERLNPLYPANHWPLNRELSQLLIYLEAPGVVGKTLALLDAAPTPEEQIHYAFHLRNLKTGWTTEQRRQYFAWFNKPLLSAAPPPEWLRWFEEAGRPSGDGASFQKFTAGIRKEAIARLTEPQRTELWSAFAGEVVAPKPPSVPRRFVRDWKLSDLLPVLDQASKGRSFLRGQRAFNDAQCVACHRLGDDGGTVGPELTAISSRLTRRDILESILEPSKVVSEQYQGTLIVKKNGQELAGRVVEENDRRLVLITDPLKQARAEVSMADIGKRAPARTSAMRAGLVNALVKEEILDLLAFLESGGKKEHAAFSR